MKDSLQLVLTIEKMNAHRIAWQALGINGLTMRPSFSYNHSYADQSSDRGRLS